MHKTYVRRLSCFLLTSDAGLSLSQKCANHAMARNAVAGILQMPHRLRIDPTHVLRLSQALITRWSSHC